MNKVLSILCIAISFASIATAKNMKTDSITALEYEVRIGVNIGGSSPLSMPREIRSIDSYNPRFNGVVEADVTKWFNNKSHWGISAGLRIESKSMHTGADVKNYQTEVVNEGNYVSGYWTGYVNTKYNTTMISIPIMANYKLNNKWKFRAGVYLSYLFHRDFSGYVTDGYLRQGTPVGQKIQFLDGKRGTYDFSDNLRRLQPGVQAGASWMCCKNININADLQFGLNDIFEDSFKTVTFNMYPIYLNLGIGYRF